MEKIKLSICRNSLIGLMKVACHITDSEKTNANAKFA
jgi:hypothetical protein